MLSKQAKESIKRYASIIICLVLGLTVLMQAGCKKEPIEESPETTQTTVQETTEATTAETTAPEQVGPVSRLNGLPMDEADLNRRILAVTFDNHPAARPQAGLRQADIVYEIKVEGTYTRYMALYQYEDPELVGSIRSARDCFLDRTVEFNACYAHFGGSYLALQRIEQYQYSDLNGMSNASGAMYRNNDTGKSSPHNVYADVAKLREQMADSGEDFDVEFIGYPFNTEPLAPEGGDVAEQVTLQYASDNQTSYEYDADTGKYLRYKEGTLDVDENDNEPLLVENIIIQKSLSYIDPAPLRTVEQIGSGEGFYVSRGKYIPIIWDKPEELAQTAYYIQTGDEWVPIKLNPGQTWIQVVDPDTPLTFE
ncbi:MAG TPA: DUF3048 domain-containing protein [Clostridiaceae bacterium]|nr:DUF3048 domain-containing protein [Clostridiaceae bacterium]